MKFYHITYATNLDSIKENGLIPNHHDNFNYEKDENLTAQNGVYLTTDLEHGLRIFTKHPESIVLQDKETMKQGLVVLEVEPPGNLLVDKNSRSSWLTDAIPPENITVTDIRNYSYADNIIDEPWSDKVYEDMSNHFIDNYVIVAAGPDNIMEFIQENYGTPSNDFTTMIDNYDHNRFLYDQAIGLEHDPELLAAAVNELDLKYLNQVVGMDM